MIYDATHLELGCNLDQHKMSTYLMSTYNFLVSFRLDIFLKDTTCWINGFKDFKKQSSKAHINNLSGDLCGLEFKLWIA